MLNAVVRKRAIVPLEPLPEEWQEGTALEVAKASDSAADIDVWAKLMDQLCGDSCPEEEASMQAAIEKRRRQAKAPARR
jgi:hypothetical protein